MTTFERADIDAVAPSRDVLRDLLDGRWSESRRVDRDVRDARPR
ncbi:MAG TPA: hypothetical protein VFQ15_01245 [Jiangellaceae bacterium]|nr:hypothetical protein [Jiangellaceae bacterium]